MKRHSIAFIETLTRKKEKLRLRLQRKDLRVRPSSPPYIHGGKGSFRISFRAQPLPSTQRQTTSPFFPCILSETVQKFSSQKNKSQNATSCFGFLSILSSPENITLMPQTRVWIQQVDPIQEEKRTSLRILITQEKEKDRLPLCRLRETLLIR